MTEENSDFEKILEFVREAQNRYFEAAENDTCGRQDKYLERVHALESVLSYMKGLDKGREENDEDDEHECPYMSRGCSDWNKCWTCYCEDE